MVINRVIDDAAVAAASLARGPVRAAREQALRHALSPGAAVWGARLTSACRRSGRRGRTASRCGNWISTTRSWPPSTPTPATTSRRSSRSPSTPAAAGADLVRAVAAAYEMQVDLVEGHLPARAQDRPHRAPRPVGRRGHRGAARASTPRSCTRRSVRRCTARPDPAVPQGRDLQLEGLRPGVRRQDGHRGGRPGDARRGRADARSTRARTG